jgi:hypothetical protein
MRGGRRQRAGAKDRKPFPLSFIGSLKVDFRSSLVTDDGLLLIGELDELFAQMLGRLAALPAPGGLRRRPGQAGACVLPRVGAGEVLPKSPQRRK